jgi:hypothetical protein
LDTTVDRVVEGIGRVLGKHTLSDDDSIMVNGSVELSCGVFDRLRFKEWLNCWDIAAALEIDDDRCEGPQVYICPMNVNANHFTLLEINEQTKMIYHYDSMASRGIIYRKTKSTLVRRVVEVSEFGQVIKWQCLSATGGIQVPEFRIR